MRVCVRVSSRCLQLVESSGERRLCIYLTAHACHINSWKRSVGSPKKPRALWHRSASGFSNSSVAAVAVAVVVSGVPVA